MMPHVPSLYFIPRQPGQANLGLYGSKYVQGRGFFPLAI